MTHPQGYSRAQIVLHWLVALLVLAQYLFKDSIAAAWQAIRAGKEYAFDPLILAHVAGGGLILALVLWRLALRRGHGAPLPPANEPAMLKTLSRVAHGSLYAVLAVMSVSGALAWFADLTLAAQVHNIFKVALLALVALHVLAVPFHRMVLGNNVMARMIRPGG